VLAIIAAVLHILLPCFGAISFEVIQLLVADKTS